MTIDKISVKKARVHNLKNVSVDIPKNSFCVITGPSGSGKSSLAFDTIYIEGQRRYIESLSSYARQFLGQLQPPDVESITGLSPAIAIDQKSTSNNPRSTVGTITEIYDYLRVLYARVGTAHCPESGEPIQGQTPQQIIKKIETFPNKSKVIILSPIIKNRKGAHKDLLDRYQKMGFGKVRIDGNVYSLEDDIKINKNLFHNIELVVDRILIKPGITSRLTDSVELALKLSDGHLIVNVDGEDHFFSEKNFSLSSGRSYPDLEPRLFSFNSPVGACSKCNGIGKIKSFSEVSLVEDRKKPLLDGAMPILQKNSFLKNMIVCIAKGEKQKLDIPYEKLPKKFKNILYEGSDKIYSFSFESDNSIFKFKKTFLGISSWLERKYEETSSEKVRVDLENHMSIETCSACDGQRLAPFPLAVTIADKNIIHLANLSIKDAYTHISSIKLNKEKTLIAEKVLKEVLDRLKFLLNVGLDYLSLNRAANTLSGGETQRIRLATQIGSALSGVLYVLDEPSIGLHQRDNDRLIKTMSSLKELGNTVLVVEHDEDTMRECDYIIDIGPGAGRHGGKVVAQGTFNEIIKSKDSLTAKYLNGKLKIEVPKQRRSSKSFLSLIKAQDHNLKSINVDIPLGTLTCVTGVSGSGKSTLVHKVLVPALKNHIKGTYSAPEYYNYKSLKGFEEIESIIELDQSPIGRTPKSNPATYSGLFNLIRSLFASTNESKTRGYKQGRFSFNVKGGRCEHCDGNGNIKVEMHFLPDVFLTCPECDGLRYNEETLRILYRGKSIADVLPMTIEEARDFFQHHKKIYKILDTLYSVGLGYMTLGQSSTTLSGGEAQRLKLSRELAKSTKGHCFYVLDEPTTGLHFNDINMLLNAVNKLVEQGNTVVIIEHNLDVIKTADYIIDLGPEGGDGGGEVVTSGTPEEILKSKKSYTAKFLKKYL